MQGAGGHPREEGEWGASSPVWLRTLCYDPRSHPVPASVGPPGVSSPMRDPPSRTPLYRAIWVCSGPGPALCPSPPLLLAGTCPAGW